MTDTLLTSPLYDINVSLGGRMVEFAGWSMPVTFAGIKEEHVHTRTACSVFDVSHMGRLVVTGSDREAFLDRICTRKLAGGEVGRSYYTHICREDGGVLDDAIASKFDSHWGVVCNGANRAKIVAWLEAHVADFDVALRDETESTAMLALQGPKTMELVEQLTGLDLSSMKRYRFVTHDFMGMPLTIYRSGYTGEDGVEVVAPASVAKMAAPMLLGTPENPHPVIRPAGLGARDTLRIEAAMPLYGQELSEDVDPLTAGQGWCVDLGQDFIGAAPMRAIKEEGPAKQLVGLELDGRRIARQHHAVLADGSQVGEVTSGTLSPTLGKSIAMGYVAPDHALEGAAMEIELGSKRIPARVVKLPFYKRPAR